MCVCDPLKIDKIDLKKIGMTKFVWKNEWKSALVMLEQIVHKYIIFSTWAPSTISSYDLDSTEMLVRTIVS